MIKKEKKENVKMKKDKKMIDYNSLNEESRNSRKEKRS